MSNQLNISYDETIENAIKKIVDNLKHDYVISKKSVALLLLQEDEDMLEKVRENEGSNYIKIIDIIEKTKEKSHKPLSYIIALHRQKEVEKLTSKVVTQKGNIEKSNASEFLSKLTMNPITGIPILILVVYFGFYKFVGEFGAGTVVDFLEENIFGNFVNPWVDNFVNSIVPWSWLQDLIANEYGIITLGIRYAVAIVLPIVGAFFLVFSIIEDSGYLPRLAMLVDRVFKKIGLNGRAVIPMVLGFGCDTMATMVSRTLETKRERIIATLLLALAIPCSAQLGVIMALLSGNKGALGIWFIFIMFVFLFIGFLTSKILPGEGPSFYMEVPPLRMPKLSNVLSKTYTRMQWYFVEIIPLFIFASILIWAGNITGLFNLLISWLEPIVNMLGLPNEAAEVFLFGFFRRDYGAAGLFDLQKASVLNPRQLVVSAATLTLFLPCVAQFAMMVKERGAKTALAMSAFILVFSFAAGYVLNQLLLAIGILS
ncbi:ferrous iron transport protein B [Proteiniborus ethanoligenes]|uniref:Ferrous iron transport protein B n=1 Tax=Proteiniborus ethanoligenes TaxID=415015 RepID=A0A1H3SQX4_9FIRM|nr:ferrous iron transporter B [Proteiniborus ethanoligenes]TAH62689.1 MAG: ferrous iron transporter B [Gottschalkiaceae bacterium]SDZ39951.1 ferrous iron transport protein B [Proteiniborus ethanoligenes]